MPTAPFFMRSRLRRQSWPSAGGPEYDLVTKPPAEPAGSTNPAHLHYSGRCLQAPTNVRN